MKARDSFPKDWNTSEGKLSNSNLTIITHKTAERRLSRINNLEIAKWERFAAVSRFTFLSTTLSMINVNESVKRTISCTARPNRQGDLSRKKTARKLRTNDNEHVMVTGQIMRAAPVNLQLRVAICPVYAGFKTAVTFVIFLQRREKTRERGGGEETRAKIARNDRRKHVERRGQGEEKRATRHFSWPCIIINDISPSPFPPSPVITPRWTIIGRQKGRTAQTRATTQRNETKLLLIPSWNLSCLMSSL